MEKVNINEGMPLRQACIFPGMSDVVERIKQVLIADGLTDRQIRTELAAVCGITYQSVKGWFDGATKNIQAANLARIARHWSLAA